MIPREVRRRVLSSSTPGERRGTSAAARRTPAPPSKGTRMPSETSDHVPTPVQNDPALSAGVSRRRFVGYLVAALDPVLGGPDRPRRTLADDGRGPGRTRHHVLRLGAGAHRHRRRHDLHLSGAGPEGRHPGGLLHAPGRESGQLGPTDHRSDRGSTATSSPSTTRASVPPQEEFPAPSKRPPTTPTPSSRRSTST